MSQSRSSPYWFSFFFFPSPSFHFFFLFPSSPFHMKFQLREPADLCCYGHVLILTLLWTREEKVASALRQWKAWAPSLSPSPSPVQSTESELPVCSVLRCTVSLPWGPPPWEYRWNRTCVGKGGAVSEKHRSWRGMQLFKMADSGSTTSKCVNE